ncbi:5-methyltetrahydropteroyltriglutamate--homocysteine S-methyltransferase [Paenibacillus sp. TRM 82003]|nr:5-methyltetrahydropteroyltriglutamate--homocysteine S-methyltransferase [Paenibacillus sp. TRM 82003]
MAKCGVLGYPRIGADREWKRTLEAYWAGRSDESAFRERMRDIRLERLRAIQSSGVDVIPVGDFSFYDHMLDTAAMLGLVPQRFGYKEGVVPLSVYFGMARGTAEAPACEMTKWFNTNYHYIVPELDETAPAPTLTVNAPLQAYREAKEALGLEGRPVVVGPFTFLKLSKGIRAGDGAGGFDAWLDRLIPLYAQLLRELEREGVEWVQIDEPSLVAALSDADGQRLHKIYGAFASAAPGVKVMLQTYFDAVDRYSDVCALPVAGIGLDFAAGLTGNVAAIRRHGFPEGKTLGAGVVDGRGVWRTPLRERLTLLRELASAAPDSRLLVQSSCSLLHVPVAASAETELPSALREALGFAEEKLEELAFLASAVDAGGSDDERVEASLAANDRALQALAALPERNRVDVWSAVGEMLAREPHRRPFAERHALQQERFRLPPLPTTTIGSFPQSPEVRAARRQWRKGMWSDERYAGYVRDQIDAWIDIQEEIGLDVLVHGEFERTDMVEFFGEKLDGFAFTSNGWVQSYGSRCVKPPILYGDVAFRAAMTVEETAYAQSRTVRPVKGMLTGPVTILNWSFVREDLPQEQVAYQLAYAIRQEVEALEQAGIGMIQVDEPAVREGLPLKAEAQAAYLSWAVDAFRWATCSVGDATQIHTHMCYCEFHDMLEGIDAMDADVISIEASRSRGDLVESFETRRYARGIGLGVYDIHSPRVPRVAEMTEMIERALRVLDARLFWINPDCGLKTRGREETVEALRRMVEAAGAARERIARALHR